MSCGESEPPSTVAQKLTMMVDVQIERASVTDVDVSRLLCARSLVYGG